MKVSFRKSEKSIIKSIRGGDSKVMGEVYSKYRNEFVQWSKSKFSISEDDALEHYQETLTIFFEKVINGSLEELQSNLKTYLFGIGKNRVRQQFDEAVRVDRHGAGLLEHSQFLAEDDDAAEDYEESRNMIAQLFDTIGDACKELLRLFYFEKKSMSEIAGIMGHKSEAVSRTTKKRCLEKIRSEHIKPLANG